MGRFTLFTGFFLVLALCSGARADITVSVKEIRGGYSQGNDRPTLNRYFFEIQLVSSIIERCVLLFGCVYSDDSHFVGHPMTRRAGTLGNFPVRTDQLATYDDNARSAVLTIPSAAIRDFKRYITRKSSYSPSRQLVNLMIFARERSGWWNTSFLDGNVALTNLERQTIRFTNVNGFTAELEINGRE